MTIEREITGACRVGINSDVVDIAQALRSLEPNDRHRKNELFSKLYPVITEMLERNVTRKSILEVLSAKGLKLHPARFKELMEAEAKLRLTAGVQAVEEDGQ